MTVRRGDTKILRMDPPPQSSRPVKAAGSIRSNFRVICRGPRWSGDPADELDDGNGKVEPAAGDTTAARRFVYNPVDGGKVRSRMVVVEDDLNTVTDYAQAVLSVV